MQALSVEHLIQNFFGMSLKYQILFIDEVKKSYYRSDTFNDNNKTVINSFFKAYQEFCNLFGEYYFDKITLFLESKNEYDKLNSTQRRNLRYRTLKILEDSANNHECRNKEFRIKQFLYMNSIKCDTKEEFDEIVNSHFNPTAISDEEAEDYIELYNIMDCDDQKDFLSEMFNFYNRAEISFYSNDYPAPENIVKEYDDIIKKLFGDELFEYYKNLASNEKIFIIENIAKIIKSFKTTYDSELVLDKDHVVKYQKMRTIDACQRSISR